MIYIGYEEVSHEKDNFNHDFYTGVNDAFWV